MIPSSLPTQSLAAMAALCAVVALILLASRGARLFGIVARPRPGQRMALAETLALDSRRRLHLVVVDGRSVLLLTGPDAAAVADWPRETAPRETGLRETGA